jgi:hypothetical protein
VRRTLPFVAASLALALVAGTASAQFTNAGFESGDLTGWTVDQSNPAPAAVADGHTGTYSALLGSTVGETPGDSSIYQTITVPAGSPVLTFWYRTQTVDSIAFDWQDAYIQDTSGNTLATIFHLCQTSDWAQRAFDLSPFAGQTVRVVFLAHGDDAGDPTSMNIDDAAVVQGGACCVPTISGGCTVATPDACTAMGGTFHGAGSTCATAHCPAPPICNGGFESGDFQCWTPVGDQTFNGVETGGAHGGDDLAYFGPISPDTGGIEQTVVANAGDVVTVDFWYLIDADAIPNSFTASLAGEALVSLTDDVTNTVWTEFTFTRTLAVSNPTLSFIFQNDPAFTFLDDVVVTVTPGGPACYANCDHSTAIPFLNVQDFSCFLTKYASGDAYANCDGSTQPPVLNVQDFSCFLTKYATGCSAP